MSVTCMDNVKRLERKTQFKAALNEKQFDMTGRHKAIFFPLFHLLPVTI